MADPIESSERDQIAQAGRGNYWQALKIGEKFRTFRRTITETDLINFVSVTGMLEALFIDVDHGGAISGRLVPSALTYTFIEGFILQNMIRGVGLALLSASMDALAPVRVGDTIWAIVETTDLRPTAKGNRAVVSSDVTIFNQLNEVVMTYRVKRLLAGDPACA
jgi:3-hydroxybutyryl-CoA dehydratase